MEKPKLSIIIPVYDVEQYVVKCIKSVLDQNVPSDRYEIIIINDGSTDNSIDMLQKSIASDKYTLLEQKNKGLSASRNRGLKEAKGEYIWYIDSDDWITENVFKDIFSFLNGVDVLALCSFIKEGNWSGYDADFIKSYDLNGKELCGRPHLTAAQFYIYRRQFLLENNLNFYEGIYHEDADLTPRILYLSNSISYLKYPIYHFLKRKESITTTINPKRVIDYFKVIERTIFFYNSSVASANKKFFINIIADDFLEVMNISLQLTVNYQDKVNEFLKLHCQYANSFLYSPKVRVKIMGFLCVLFPKHVYIIFKTLSKLRY